MTPTPGGLPNELSRRHRTATIFIVSFLVLDAALLVLAYFAAEKIFRPNDPTIVMGLWIAILVFGLGAFVLRRTRFAAMRLKDIAALKGTSGLLKSLQDTTIQIAFIGGAIALMGFIVTILSGDWTSMLRASGVSAIVLIYGYPFRSAWERVARQLSDYSQVS
jgi:divalent metal cation (Fe/Co/Zn/Cd) transporter